MALIKHFCNFLQFAIFFICNHLLSSTWVQHAKTFAKNVLQHFCKCFSVNHFKNIFESYVCFVNCVSVYAKCVCLAGAVPAASAQPQLCIPKTPKFATNRRTRKVTAQSQAELEQVEVEEMKK